ncbi:MAG: hypothetical protein E4H15_03580 [Syntrophobacterales bacterium]|nr:MAG: hypothetical protein E4H15_03580 [Syntrophobacterales bacterium]
MADPHFGRYQEKLRERAERLAERGDYEAADLLNTDHAAFIEACDAEKLSDLKRSHSEKLEAIQERQYQRGKLQDRDQADVDMILEKESFHEEQEKIRSGRYEDE